MHDSISFRSTNHIGPIIYLQFVVTYGKILPCLVSTIRGILVSVFMQQFDHLVLLGFDLKKVIQNIWTYAFILNIKKNSYQQLNF